MNSTGHACTCTCTSTCIWAIVAANSPDNALNGVPLEDNVICGGAVLHGYTGRENVNSLHSVLV